MEGGKAIGSGTFGCIFSPAIVFRKTPSIVKQNPEEYVCKVGEVDSIQNEVRTANKLRKAVGPRYAVLPVGSVLKNLDPDSFFQGANESLSSLAKTCKDVKVTPKTLGHRALYYMPKLQGDVYKYTDTAKLSVAHIRQGFAHYLRGLELLHAGGYAHMDIKEENIGILSPTEFVLIDFDWVTKLTPQGIQIFADDFGTSEYYAHPPWFFPVWDELMEDEINLERLIKRMRNLRGDANQATKTPVIQDFVNNPEPPLTILFGQLQASKTPFSLLLQYVDCFSALRVLINLLAHSAPGSQLLKSIEAHLFDFTELPGPLLRTVQKILEST